MNFYACDAQGVVIITRRVSEGSTDSHFDQSLAHASGYEKLTAPKGCLLPRPACNAGSSFDRKRQCQWPGTWLSKVANGPAISCRAGQQNVPLALYIALAQARDDKRNSMRYPATLVFSDQSYDIARFFNGYQERTNMPFIEQIEPEDATGRLKRIYDCLLYTSPSPRD